MRGNNGNPLPCIFVRLCVRSCWKRVATTRWQWPAFVVEKSFTRSSFLRFCQTLSVCRWNSWLHYKRWKCHYFQVSCEHIGFAFKFLPLQKKSFFVDCNPKQFVRWVHSWAKFTNCDWQSGPHSPEYVNVLSITLSYLLSNTFDWKNLRDMETTVVVFKSEATSSVAVVTQTRPPKVALTRHRAQFKLHTLGVA